MTIFASSVRRFLAPVLALALLILVGCSAVLAAPPHRAPSTPSITITITPPAAQRALVGFGPAEPGGWSETLVVIHYMTNPITIIWSCKMVPVPPGAPVPVMAFGVIDVTDP